MKLVGVRGELSLKAPEGLPWSRAFPWGGPLLSASSCSPNRRDDQAGETACYILLQQAAVPWARGLHRGPGRRPSLEQG